MIKVYTYMILSSQLNSQIVMSRSREYKTMLNLTKILM